MNGTRECSSERGCHLSRLANSNDGMRSKVAGHSHFERNHISDVYMKYPEV